MEQQHALACHSCCCPKPGGIRACGRAPMDVKPRLASANGCCDEDARGEFEMGDYGAAHNSARSLSSAQALSHASSHYENAATLTSSGG
mmetsp:Transcript_42519/g.92629  ORF Transcript_42519/g.92629 Transcript_42519/m.92629 type:complete len:89 (+) Transcript_42519:192-458(+)